MTDDVESLDRKIRIMGWVIRALFVAWVAMLMFDIGSKWAHVQHRHELAQRFTDSGITFGDLTYTNESVCWTMCLGEDGVRK